MEREIYHPGGKEIPLSTDNFGHEPIQYLAKQMFALPERCLFTQLHSSVDPRGFFDLYGTDPEREYYLNEEEKKLKYHALSCFFTHISFIFENRFSCLIVPEKECTRLIILDEEDNENFKEIQIQTREDFLCSLSSALADMECGKS